MSSYGTAFGGADARTIGQFGAGASSTRFVYTDVINPGGSGQVAINNAVLNGSIGGSVMNQPNGLVQIGSNGQIPPGVNNITGFTQTLAQNANSAIGVLCMTGLTSATNNTAMGWNSGVALTGGSNNALFGASAGANLQIASRCTMIGQNAGNQSTQADNTMLGYNAGWNIVTGTANVVIGSGAGANMQGNNGVIIGYGAGASAVSTSSVLIGMNAGAVNAVAGSVFIGSNAGLLCTGSRNVFMGSGAGTAITTSSDNTFIGDQAGAGGSTQSSCTFIGSSAGATWLGSNNCAVGYQAGYQGGTGTNGVCVGYQAGKVCTGAGNVWIGYQAGLTSTTNLSCVAIGSGAVIDPGINLGTAVGAGAIVNFNGGVAIGYASQAATAGAVAVGNFASGTGLNSTALGPNANTNASNAIAIGNNAIASALASIGLGTSANASASNSTVIGYGLTNSVANSTVIGNNSAESFRLLDPAVGNFTHMSVASTSASASVTLTAAMLLGGYITLTNAGAISATIDTGANLDANAQIAGNPYVGLTFSCTVVSTASQVITFAGAAGTTLYGTAAATATARLVFVRTGAATYSVVLAGGAGSGGVNDIALQGNTTQTASATGTTAVAIGHNSSAAGNYGIALGPSASASIANTLIVKSNTSLLYATNTYAPFVGSYQTGVGSNPMTLDIYSQGSVIEFQNALTYTANIPTGATLDGNWTSTLGSLPTNQVTTYQTWYIASGATVNLVPGAGVTIRGPTSVSARVLIVTWMRVAANTWFLYVSS